MNAACPDCTWTILFVIGRVDSVPLAPPARGWRWPWAKPLERTEQIGDACKCARCGLEFYVAQGQVHRLFVGNQQPPSAAPPPPTRTYPNGTTTRSRFDDAGALTPGIDDLRPPPD